MNKKVDESWKERVAQEKGTFGEPSASPGQEMPEAGFSYFISTLGMQVLVALGEIAHPTSGQKETNLAEAHYLIDTLAMLSEKTRGNLDPQEDAMLKNLLYELQMKFVQKSQAGTS